MSPQKKKTLLYKILKWRYRHISDKTFILILSILVGFTAGLVSYISFSLSKTLLPVTSTFSESTNKGVN